MTYLFAGDRDIAVRILSLLMDAGYPPAMLLLADPKSASHSDALQSIATLPPDRVFEGAQGWGEKATALMKRLRPDYLISIHYPHLLPKTVLQIPTIAALNLHPAWLPYNRGWHTPSWAILEGTPAGATLHHMTEQTDAGQIVLRKRTDISPADTAHTLYLKIKDTAVELFQEAIPLLAGREPGGTPQPAGEGTFHKKEDLDRSGIREIELDATYTGRELINRLRALTTSRKDEAAWFREGGRIVRVQVQLSEERPEL